MFPSSLPSHVGRTSSHRNSSSPPDFDMQGPSSSPYRQATHGLKLGHPMQLWDEPSPNHQKLQRNLESFDGFFLTQVCPRPIGPLPTTRKDSRSFSSTGSEAAVMASFISYRGYAQGVAQHGMDLEVGCRTQMVKRTGYVMHCQNLNQLRINQFHHQRHAFRSYTFLGLGANGLSS